MWNEVLPPRGGREEPLEAILMIRSGCRDRSRRRRGFEQRKSGRYGSLPTQGSTRPGGRGLATGATGDRDAPHETVFVVVNLHGAIPASPTQARQSRHLRQTLPPASARLIVAMSWPPLPKPDRQNTLEWPWWEVDLEEEDLCGFLYKKYNTATIFLQDLPSFYRDVVELVRETKTGSKDEFLHLLGERKARREKEITSAHGQTCAALAHGSQTLSASQYRNLLRWTQYSSLDALVEFLASFGPDGGGNKRLSTGSCFLANAAPY